MAVLLTLIAGTTGAMLLLVLYGSHVFEENRTRVTRARPARKGHAAERTDVNAADGFQWQTLVDPVEAANRARASKPFAAAYARALAAAGEDSRAA